MNNMEDFKTLWTMQKEMPAPAPEKLFRKAVKSKNKVLLKFVFTALLLVVTAVGLLFIWFFLDPQRFTTKLGITLILAAIALYLVASQSIISLLYKKSSVLNLRAFLSRVKEVKEKQKALQTRVLLAYFILLSLGIFLYMVEYALKMSPGWRIFSFGLTAAWILFNWFYIRPKTIGKQQREINGIISRLEEAGRQLSA